jgi:hypothetical protein
MRRKKPYSPPPMQLQQALDWLAEPEQDDPLLDLVPLRTHIAAIGSLQLPALHRLKIDELLQQRAERIESALTPMLLDVKLPLPIDFATIAQSLIRLRAELGETWLKVAGEVDPRELSAIHRSRSQICLQGVFNLSRQFVATLLIAIPTPLNLWRNVHELYLRAHESVDPTATLPAEIGAIDGRFKFMLALNAAQPEGLAPREISFLADYLQNHGAAARIDRIRPEMPGDWFWLDANLDQPPVSFARISPNADSCLYVRFGELADLAAQHLDQLNDGVPPQSLGLPPQAAGADYRNALERARQRWAIPPRRSFSRRPQNLRAEVCTQLSSLWTALDSGAELQSESTASQLPCSNWALLNDSPSGYAVVHALGEVAGIVPGCAVGIRTSAGSAWQICLVRWARSKNSSHVELGLEILAPSAKPVRIQAIGGRSNEEPIPALLLPALPALGRGEAILAVRGDYNARPFTLLQQHGARLQVVACMPHRTLIETSSIEVFEFIRNSSAN